jgi:hypothetical protein
LIGTFRFGEIQAKDSYLHLDDRSLMKRSWEFQICEIIYLLREFNLIFFTLATYNRITQKIWFLIKALMKVIRKAIIWGVTFIVKQVRLGFPSFASKLVKEQRRVVHVASSRRACGSEAKDGQFDGIGCDAVEVKPNYPSLDVFFLLAEGHSSLLVFTINRIIGLL